MSKRRKKSTDHSGGKSFRVRRLEELNNIDVAKFDADAELWERGKLGTSAKHARPVSDEQDRALYDGLGLRLLSFRIQRSLIEKLKEIARLEGIGYQPLMRQILTRYDRENEHRLKLPKERKKYKSVV